MEQQNLLDARQARDAGITKTAVKNDSWLELALKKLPEMKEGGFATTTGEGIRCWLKLHGFSEPTSPHAWGALVRTAMKRGLIKDTGRIVQMAMEKSHARRTPLWEIL